MNRSALERDAMNFSALERVVVPMHQPIEQYAAQVRALAGENGLALTLFGEIATGTFDLNKNTVRNVLVLNTVDLEVLRLLAQSGAKLGKARISAPLIMTPAYINASLDAFPLEMIEIHQSNMTLFGEDYFNALSFNEGHIRLQCERELKSILIGMRQGLLAAAGRERLLGMLETQVVERLIRTIRGVLWLKAEKGSRSPLAMISEMEKMISRPLSGVQDVIRMGGQPGWEPFKRLYSDIETLGGVVDAL